MMTIHLYAQHAGRAGQVCHDADAIERGADDIFAVSGDDAELLDYAMHSAAKSLSSFEIRVARSILETLEDAPDAMQSKLRELGASEEELEWAWSAQEIDLLRLARGRWEHLLPAIRREMASEIDV